jgi:hypothetical protein
MNQNQIEKIEKCVLNLKEKKSKIYLFVQDTKGNAKASLSYIYNVGMALLENGFNPIMLHEKPDYVGVGEWLGEDYMEKLPHKSVEGQNLEISPDDFIIIPELFGYILPQIQKVTCGKIVLCQSYDYILETLTPGQTWNQFGFFKCITTSEAQKELIEGVMRGVTYDIVEPFISDEFKLQTLPPKPIIAIHAREQRDSVNLIKKFYLKFPQYRWVTFRDMRGLTQKQFADALQDCFLSVWIDEESSYGTFPLESMKSGVPVLGLTPNLLPNWMTSDNGVWVNNKLQMADFIADFLQNWLEDNINENLFVEMEKTVEKLPSKENFNKNVVELFEKYINTRLSSFEEQIEKLKETV